VESTASQFIFKTSKFSSFLFTCTFTLCCEWFCVFLRFLFLCAGRTLSA
jgi:hypothetical protein